MDKGRQVTIFGGMTRNIFLLGLISLFTFLEQEFNIQITDADLVEENFESVNAITNFVLQRQN